MQHRVVCLLQLCAILAALTAACASRTEDTSCPAMQRALDEAEQAGILEPLPLRAEGGGYGIVLETRDLQANCDTVYRFRVTGVDKATWKPSPGPLDEAVCGPGGSTGKTVGWEGDDLVLHAGLRQWRPTGEVGVSVGKSCGDLTLTFTHVGRIAQP